MNLNLSLMCEILKNVIVAISYIFNLQFFSQNSPSVNHEKEENKEKDTGKGPLVGNGHKEEPPKPSEVSLPNSAPLLPSRSTTSKSSTPAKQYGTINALDDSVNTTKNDLNSSVTGIVYTVLG